MPPYIHPLPPFVSVLVRLFIVIILAGSSGFQGVIFLSEPGPILGLDHPMWWGIGSFIICGEIVGGLAFRLMWVCALGLMSGGMWYALVALMASFSANRGDDSWAVVVGSFTLASIYVIVAMIMAPPMIDARLPDRLNPNAGEDDDGR